MCHVFPTVQRIQSSFYRFNEPRLVIQVVSDYGLRKFFGITPRTLSEL